MLKNAFSISSFVLKHIVAALVSIVAPIILWIIVYFILFLIALFTDTGLGGLLSLPFGAVFLFIVSTIYTIAFLFSSVLIAEVATHGFGKWHHLAQIPISTFILAALIFIARMIVHRNSELFGSNYLAWVNYPWIVFLCLLIPLGVYWWTMKIVQTGISLPGFIFNRLKKALDSKNMPSRR